MNNVFLIICCFQLCYIFDRYVSWRDDMYFRRVEFELFQIDIKFVLMIIARFRFI